MTCRFNFYYNQYDAEQLGYSKPKDVPLWMYKPSVWHIFRGDNNKCNCGMEEW